jgi:hypothetical protein
MAPHTGQSSQLSLDANDGNAQFLPNLAGAVVLHTRHKSFKRVLRTGHSGQSSQLFLRPPANCTASSNSCEKRYSPTSWIRPLVPRNVSPNLTRRSEGRGLRQTLATRINPVIGKSSSLSNKKARRKRTLAAPPAFLRPVKSTNQKAEF